MQRLGPGGSRNSAQDLRPAAAPPWPAPHGVCPATAAAGRRPPSGTGDALDQTDKKLRAEDEDVK